MIEHNILYSIHELAKWAASNKMETQHLVIDGWKKRLGTDDDQLVVKFCFLLSLACENLSEVLNDSDLRDEVKRSYNAALFSFETMIAVQSMNARWNQTREKHIRPDVVAHLMGISTASEIIKYFSSQHIEEQQLNELNKNLESLKKAIDTQVKDILLKKYLIKEIEFLIFSSEHFNILGSVGIESSASNILRKCITEKEKIPQSLWKKAAGMSMYLLQIIAFVGAVNSGIETIGNGASWLIETTDELKKAELPEIKMIEDKTNSNSDDIIET